ncbi:sigma-70 family RNA polymerase sigma factor, partial [bacterium]|nr:sigma-70 family RNA polymerase sigma factor [bacterium]
TMQKQELNQTFKPVIAMNSEMDLLFRARNGDAIAAEEIFTKYLKASPSVNGLLRKCLRNLADREDLLQDIYLRLLSGANTFRGEAQLSTYIYQVARITVFQKFRRENTLKRGKGFRRISESFEIEDRPESNPEYSYRLRQAQMTLNEMIDSLPMTCQRVMHLRLLGLEYEEIATRLGLPVNTVSSKIHKARKMLEEMKSRLMGDREISGGLYYATSI